MNQTFYAVLAMMLLSLFSLHQRRAIIHAQGEMMQTEVQRIAVSVAKEELDRVNVMTFDKINTNSRSYTANVPMEGTTMDFGVKVKTTYVKKQGDAMVSSASETRFKQVTVSVEGPLNGNVTMSRVYSNTEE